MLFRADEGENSFDHGQPNEKARRANTGAGIAQLVERPTEKPGAILTRVRVQGSARYFSPSADSLTVSVQPPCAMACINSCVHVKNPEHWQPHHCLDTLKYYTH